MEFIHKKSIEEETAESDLAYDPYANMTEEEYIQALEDELEMVEAKQASLIENPSAVRCYRIGHEMVFKNSDGELALDVPSEVEDLFYARGIGPSEVLNKGEVQICVTNIEIARNMEDGIAATRNFIDTLAQTGEQQDINK